MVKFSLVLLSLLILPAAASAVDAVDFELRVYQTDPVSGNDRLLLADTTAIVSGYPAQGFLLMMSVDLELTAADSTEASFLVHAVTLNDIPQNFARSFRVEYGLQARLDSIRGKNETVYSLRLSPLQRRDYDTTGCGYSHRRAGEFKVDPSAYADIYFVPQSLGDFYWNSVKALVDERYELYRDINHFTTAGKYAFYLCPCLMPSVIWDKRFGTMIDPTSSTAFALYTREFSSAYPFVIMHAATLRNYGYAPPFLSEGLAGYLGFARYDMKKMAQAGQVVPLGDLMNTHRYLTTDPILADRTAASFVRYLIDQYKITTFLTVYRQADDLTLRDTLEKVYGRSLGTLEREWLTYLDTLTVQFAQVAQFADEAETMRDYRQLLIYSEDMLREAISTQDSLTAMIYLVRASFFNGDYYKATEYAQRQAALQPANARSWMSLAAYQMMNGLYDDAFESLTKARGIDSSDMYIAFNLGLNHLYRGQREDAAFVLEQVVRKPDGAPAIEARLTLASILFRSQRSDDMDRARRLCREAADKLAPLLAGGTSSAASYLWAGIAYLGLEDTGTAWDYLQVAQLLESRPFYQGMIHLWLGKVADVRGEHDVAREYYGRVLSLASSDYHQKEARALLKGPYVY
ncbi:MAG: hypothetical protein RBT76_02235 [candidate division Zixibacteria bacterium]|jgi:Flp pilus assembly protein TadD|nr:hypothetical protein [candidate division Zixibacteria bacterium]